MDVVFRSDVSVELVNASASDDQVVRAARVSTVGARSIEPSEPDNSSAGLIKYLMKNLHGSTFEHNMFTFFVQAPIFVFREFIRHRTFSFNEESGRYKVLEPVFYVPGPDRSLQQVGKPGHYKFVPGTEEQYNTVVDELQSQAKLAYFAYERMLGLGVAREVARMHLPLSIYSSMYATCNARALMKFLSLRVEDETATFPSHPQKEIEMVAQQMETHFAKAMPITYQAFIEKGRVTP